MKSAMKSLIISLAICSLGSVTVICAADQSTLDQAIKALNAQAQTDAGRKLVLNAVSQQTHVPEKTLQTHMTATHLNYGELLTAESLAQGSGKNVNAVVAMKQGKSWADLSREVKIDPNSIVSRLQSAAKLAQGGQANKTQAGNMKKPASVSPSAPPDGGKAMGY
jgi:hypothetical protein